MLDYIPTTDTETPPSSSKSPSVIGAIGVFLLELTKVALLAGVTVFLVRHFVFKPFYVKGQSMEPTFFEREYLIINQFTYRFRSPERGEIIVFHPPTGVKDFYLKRIIGLPGERVRIEDGNVIVCDTECHVLDEWYLDGTVETEGNVQLTLGPDQYFVMGDNRPNSFDSRRFGAVDADLIVGKIWFRGYPFERIGGFQNPEYTFETVTTTQ